MSDISPRISKRATAANRTNAAARKAEAKKSEFAHPATADHIDYSDDDVEFQKAMQDYQARTGRRFPSLRETLAVVKALGYSKSSSLLDFDLDDMEVRIDAREFGIYNKPKPGGN